jgi:hypothetical protein
MSCPPQVPISIIPPVPQGPSPILWQNGNQITRLLTPLNQSWLVYDGANTKWADGSAQAPISLPALQLTTQSTIAYILVLSSTGQLYKVQASVGAANSGGSGYRQIIVPN